MEEQLYHAAAWGEMDEVRRIIKTTPDVDINWKNNMGRTPLFIASSWGLWDVVELLLQHGAVVDEYILSIASYTMPRSSEDDSDTSYYYHKEEKKHQAYKIAKDFMKKARKNEEFANVLVTLSKDYKILTRAKIDPEEIIPDYIMNIVVYYNHFATIQLLLQADKSRKLQEYNSRLLEQRAKQLGELEVDDQEESGSEADTD